MVDLRGTHTPLGGYKGVKNGVNMQFNGQIGLYLA